MLVSRAVRAHGYEVAVPTVFHDAAEPVHVSVDVVVAGGDPRDHGYDLDTSQAAALSRWLLVAARADGSAAAQDVRSEAEIEVTIPDAETPGHYLMPPRGARELGEALDEALRALGVHPPREMIRTIGLLDGATTDSAAHRVEVYVTMLVKYDDDVRIKLEVPTGTWTLTDDEVAALANALAEAADAPRPGSFLALDPSAAETLREPWMTVAQRPDALVSLRLYDDLVLETGDDGVLLFPADGARELASLLRTAIAFRDATPPTPTVPPEPFERVVARAAW